MRLTDYHEILSRIDEVRREKEQAAIIEKSLHQLLTDIITAIDLLQNRVTDIEKNIGNSKI